MFRRGKNSGRGFQNGQSAAGQNIKEMEDGVLTMTFRTKRGFDSDRSPCNMQKNGAAFEGWTLAVYVHYLGRKGCVRLDIPESLPEQDKNVYDGRNKEHLPLAALYPGARNRKKEVPPVLPEGFLFEKNFSLRRDASRYDAGLAIHVIIRRVGRHAPRRNQRHRRTAGLQFITQIGSDDCRHHGHRLLTHSLESRQRSCRAQWRLCIGGWRAVCRQQYAVHGSKHAFLNGECNVAVKNRQMIV